MTIYVTGHKNPDTDTIISSIAVAELLRQRGHDAVAVSLGNLNPETKFVLDKLEIPHPELKYNLNDEDVAIVDTTDFSQLPDLTGANIVLIADHHKLGTLQTAAALEVYVQPVGSTCTVITNLFNFEGRVIPKPIASAMIFAILSDTVLFKSPTTTPFDKIAVKELRRLAEVDNHLDMGMDMLKVKSSIENETAIDLINRDFKEFHIKDKKIGVGQIELIDGTMADHKKPEILDEMKRIQKENGYNSIILLITDIMKEGSEMVIVSDEMNIMENVFGVKCDDKHCAWVDGMMSRKKQVIPNLETKL